jgi:hypothetical protein
MCIAAESSKQERLSTMKKGQIDEKKFPNQLNKDQLSSTSKQFISPRCFTEDTKENTVFLTEEERWQCIKEQAFCHLPSHQNVFTIDATKRTPRVLVLGMPKHAARRINKVHLILKEKKNFDPLEFLEWLNVLQEVFVNITALTISPEENDFVSDRLRRFLIIQRISKVTNLNGIAITSQEKDFLCPQNSQLRLVQLSSDIKMKASTSNAISKTNHYYCDLQEAAIGNETSSNPFPITQFKLQCLFRALIKLPLRILTASMIIFFESVMIFIFFNLRHPSPTLEPSLDNIPGIG